MKFKLYFILFFSFLLISCNKEKDEKRLYLTSNWTYSIDGINGSYYPIDNSQFPELSKLFKNHSGYIYLKNTFSLPDELQDISLSVYLGNTKIANRAYINGNFLGNTGFFPPNEFSAGELATAYSLPSFYLKSDEPNELLVILWVNSYGSMNKKPFISDTQDVTVTKVKNDFLNSKIFLLLAASLLVVSFIYLLLLVFRPKNKENLSFSTLTVFSALYLAIVCVGEYSSSFMGLYSFLLFEKIFHGIIAILSTNSAVSFIRDFLGKKDTKFQTILRIIFVIVPIALIIPARTMTEFTFILNISYFFLFLHILHALNFIRLAVIDHDKRVYVLMIGFTPVLISLIVLFFVTVVYNLPYSILIVVIGWLATIFSFLSILIFNFSKTQSEYEFLNKNLEKLVEERTTELSKSNFKLEEMNSKLSNEKQRAEKEIELAATLQQTFLHHEIPEVDGWEISFYSKAMAGVSGDLYDFYIDNKKLTGLGIFDISGHGISSGLVTMLVKNIIQQEFLRGKDISLDEVVTTINERVIKEKGNIENYLTGILVRVFDSSIEYVNAGHPLPFLYKINDNSFQAVDKLDSKRYGVVGIEGFKPNFETNTISFESGDEILFYTDGLTEGTNKDNIPFGRKDFMKSFKRNIIRPFEKQINGILQDFISYTETDVFSDDITLIMLKKK